MIDSVRKSIRRLFPLSRFSFGRVSISFLRDLCRATCITGEPRAPERRWRRRRARPSSATSTPSTSSTGASSKSCRYGHTLPTDISCVCLFTFVSFGGCFCARRATWIRCTWRAASCATTAASPSTPTIAPTIHGTLFTEFYWVLLGFTGFYWVITGL